MYPFLSQIDYSYWVIDNFQCMIHWQYFICATANIFKDLKDSLVWLLSLYICTVHSMDAVCSLPLPPVLAWLRIPGISGDFRGAFSAWLSGCPPDCFSPRNYTSHLKSYAEMKLRSGGHFFKFYMKAPTKIKSNLTRK